MTERRASKRQLALNTNDAVLELLTAGAQVKLEQERAEHQGSRPCIARDCNELVPCKRHGEPAGDDAVGSYFWRSA